MPPSREFEAQVIEFDTDFEFVVGRQIPGSNERKALERNARLYIEMEIQFSRCACYRKSESSVVWLKYQRKSSSKYCSWDMA